MLEYFYPNLQNVEDSLPNGAQVTGNSYSGGSVGDLFSPALIKESGSYIRYRKVFLQNTGTTTVNNIYLQLVNDGATLMKFAVEEDWDGFVFNGTEKIRNTSIEPGRLFEYTWINGASPTPFSSESSSSSSTDQAVLRC
jgi:hypothetical protein